MVQARGWQPSTISYVSNEPRVSINHFPPTYTLLDTNAPRSHTHKDNTRLVTPRQAQSYQNYDVPQAQCSATPRTVRPPLRQSTNVRLAARMGHRLSGGSAVFPPTGNTTTTTNELTTQFSTKKALRIPKMRSLSIYIQRDAE